MVDVAGDHDDAEVAEGFADPAADLGQVNIAVFGPTGAGKSSLVNAVFGDETAPTGVGEPVTQSFTGYVNPTGTLCIWDGRGGYETGERKPPSRPSQGALAQGPRADGRRLVRDP